MRLPENYPRGAAAFPSSRLTNPAPPPQPTRRLPIYKHAPGPALPHSGTHEHLIGTRHDATRTDQKRQRLCVRGEARPRSDSFRVKRGGASAEQEGLEMDAFYSTSSAAYGAAPGAGWGYDSLKNFRQITPAVQTHLKLVRLPASALPLLLSRSSENFPSPDFRSCFSSCRGLRAGFVVCTTG